MLMKKVLVSALFAAGMIAAVATPLPSVAAVDVYVNVAPPPDRHERVPPPRRGYVWVPGHWKWNAKRHRYVWAAGYWERARRGYVLQRPRWVEREGRWYYEPRRWDRDGDGVPDRRDAHPNDPYRR